MAKFTSKYVADNYLSWLKGTAYPAAPANTYVALYTTAPTARDGTGGVEVSTSGTAYARQAIASTAWGAVATSGSGTTALEQILNSNAVSFATATGNWGTVVGAGLLDAASGGNLLDYADLSASQTVNTGNTFQFNSAALAVQA